MVKDYKRDIKILVKHLNELSEDGLKDFTKNLCKLTAPRAYNPIQRKHLKGKKAEEVAEVIIRFYTKRFWKAKVMEALKMSNENQIRINLQKALNAARTGGGKVKAAKPKKKDGAGKSPKPLKKPTVNAQPTVGPTGCTAGKGQHPGVGQTNVAPKNENAGAGKSPKPTKSQQPGKDVKLKKVSQPMEKSTVKEQTGETANRKRKREEKNGEGVKPKRTKKQGTGDFPAAIQPPVLAQTVIVQSRSERSTMIVNHAALTGRVMRSSQEHFVDIHEAALIQRVALVDPILDDLKKLGLLKGEPYDTVRGMSTSQEKMRELFRHVKSWGNKDKDKLLKSLRKHNEPLIRDLEKS